MLSILLFFCSAHCHNTSCLNGKQSLEQHSHGSPQVWGQCPSDHEFISAHNPAPHFSRYLLELLQVSPFTEDKMQIYFKVQWDVRTVTQLEAPEAKLVLTGDSGSIIKPHHRSAPLLLRCKTTLRDKKLNSWGLFSSSSYLKATVFRGIYRHNIIVILQRISV